MLMFVHRHHPELVHEYLKLKIKIVMILKTEVNIVKVVNILEIVMSETVSILSVFVTLEFKSCNPRGPKKLFY
jgi:hypothetical protein